jgi:hypothetical protein
VGETEPAAERRKPERDPEAKAIARRLVAAPELDAELAQAAYKGRLL